MRERLPERRAALTTTVEFRGEKLHVSFGTFADGRLGEIFAAGPKIGSDLRTSIQEAVTAASYALQYGASPESLLAALPFDAQERPEGALGAILQAWIELCNPGASDNNKSAGVSSTAGTVYQDGMPV